MCSKSAQNGSYVKLNSVTFGSLVLDGRALTFRTVWPLLTPPVLELSVLELPVTVLCLLPLDFLCLLIYALLLTEAIAVFSRLFPAYRLFVLQQLLYTVCVFCPLLAYFFVHLHVGILRVVKSYFCRVNWSCRQQRHASSKTLHQQNPGCRLYDTIRYDTRCYFNMHSKADMSQLNLLHG